MNNFGKNLALWIVIGLRLVALFNLFQTSSTRGPQSTLAFSDFVADVNRGQVTDVTIQGDNINGHFTDGRAFTTYAPKDPGLVGRLIENAGYDAVYLSGAALSAGVLALPDVGLFSLTELVEQA